MVPSHAAALCSQRESLAESKAYNPIRDSRIGFSVYEIFGNTLGEITSETLSETLGEILSETAVEKSPKISRRFSPRVLPRVSPRVLDWIICLTLGETL